MHNVLVVKNQAITLIQTQVSKRSILVLILITNTVQTEKGISPLI
jgi:hypothetical protein